MTGTPPGWPRTPFHGFGSGTNAGECEAVCLKSIKLETIACINRDYLTAVRKHREVADVAGAS